MLDVINSVVEDYSELTYELSLDPYFPVTISFQ